MVNKWSLVLPHIKTLTINATQHDTTHQIQAIRRQIHVQDKKQETRIKEVKKLMRDQLKDQITEKMK
jgi:hypothetical protein